MQIFQEEKPRYNKTVFLKTTSNNSLFKDYIESFERDMAPSGKRGRPIASRHLVCGTCSSWVDFDSSGCTNSWAEMRGGTCVFTCKGCREVTRLVGEVEDLRQMMESMKRIVTGLGLEEKGEETEDRMAELGEAEKCEEVITPDNSTEGNRKGKATAGSISSEDRDTVIESEVEHGTEGEDTRQLIRSGTQFLATHRYEKNPDGPVGNELDLNEGDTVVYLMKNDDNEHWWLVEDGNGQVGY